MTFVLSQLLYAVIFLCSPLIADFFGRQELIVQTQVSSFFGGVKVDNKGKGKIRKYIRGMNNKIVIGKGSQMDNVLFRIVGNNSRIVFVENCKVRKNNSFWMEGSNIEM